MSNTRGCVVSPRARRGGGEFTRRTRTTTTSRDRGGDAVTPRPHAPPTDLARRGGKRNSATPSFLVLLLPPSRAWWGACGWRGHFQNTRAPPSICQCRRALLALTVPPRGCRWDFHAPPAGSRRRPSTGTRGHAETLEVRRRRRRRRPERTPRGTSRRRMATAAAAVVGTGVGWVVGLESVEPGRISILPHSRGRRVGGAEVRAGQDPARAVCFNEPAGVRRRAAGGGGASHLGGQPGRLGGIG